MNIEDLKRRSEQKPAWRQLEPCEACPTAQVTVRLRSDNSEKIAAIGLNAAGDDLEITVLT